MAQRYDSDARLTVSRSTTPILSEQTVAATEAAIQRLQTIVATAAGGGSQRPDAARLQQPGGHGAAAAADRLRRHRRRDRRQPVYDSYVESGVRRFQARHGINATGSVNAQTLAGAQRAGRSRLKQLEINLVRLRSFSKDLGARYVTRNIPAASVETVENGQVFSHHIAGVGKIDDRQSPVMQTRPIRSISTRFWTVPASVIRKDLIPKMQADPNYLHDNHIRVFNKQSRSSSPSRSTGIRSTP